jgi:hypothetical protein
MDIDGAYKQKPKIGARPGKRGKKNQNDGSDEEEDVVYFNK